MTFTCPLCTTEIEDRLHAREVELSFNIMRTMTDRTDLLIESILTRDPIEKMRVNMKSRNLGERIYSMSVEHLEIARNMKLNDDYCSGLKESSRIYRNHLDSIDV